MLDVVDALSDLGIPRGAPALARVSDGAGC
jgi:hypothetical protein